jgi:hypothetical protein
MGQGSNGEQAHVCFRASGMLYMLLGMRRCCLELEICLYSKQQLEGLPGRHSWQRHIVSQMVATARLLLAI